MFSYGKKQVGFIIFGVGMNKQRWIQDAKTQGYLVVDYGHFAALFSKARN